MAIIWAYVEGVRLIADVRPVIWPDSQLLSIIDNCEELMAYLGLGLDNDPHIHVLGVYEAWQVVVGGLVESDSLVSQRIHEVWCLIRDGHVELEKLFGILLLAICQLALDAINSNELIRISFDLHGEILFLGS